MIVEKFNKNSRACEITKNSDGDFVLIFMENNQHLAEINYAGYNIHYVREAAENYVEGRLKISTLLQSGDK